MCVCVCDEWCRHTHTRSLSHHLSDPGIFDRKSSRNLPRGRLRCRRVSRMVCPTSKRVCPTQDGVHPSARKTDPHTKTHLLVVDELRHVRDEEDASSARRVAGLADPDRRLAPLRVLVNPVLVKRTGQPIIVKQKKHLTSSALCTGERESSLITRPARPRNKTPCGGYQGLEFSHALPSVVERRRSRKHPRLRER